MSAYREDQTPGYDSRIRGESKVVMEEVEIGSPQSAHVTGLLMVQDAFRKFLNSTGTFGEAALTLRQLRGHDDLKELFEDYLRTRRGVTLPKQVVGRYMIRAIQQKIEEIQTMPVAEVSPESDYDSENDIYYDLDSDELDEMTTDEDSDSEDRPPVARRLRF